MKNQNFSWIGLVHITYIQVFKNIYRMKRLIVIIKILLTSILGFGQVSAGLLSNFNHKAAYEFVGFEEGANGCYIYPLMPSKSEVKLNDSAAIKYSDWNRCSFIESAPKSLFLPTRH
jgi:hypothetical protein